MIKQQTINKFIKKNPVGYLDGLPKEINISTMTITCSLDTQINVSNVGKYIDLSVEGITSIKQNGVIRTTGTGKKIHKARKAKKNFLNQASVYIKVSNDKEMNVKLFSNGSFQLTGCSNMKQFLVAMSTLCKELSKNKAVFDTEQKTIIDKPFVTTPKNLKIGLIKNFKIRMINTNFDAGFQVDRQVLYKILKNKGIEVVFEPMSHAGVRMKYNYHDTAQVSVFVFASGSTVITGAKCKGHIAEAYKYIIDTFYENYKNIVRNNTEEFLNREEIQELIVN